MQPPENHSNYLNLTLHPLIFGLATT